jgi:hypothetical protein
MQTIHEFLLSVGYVHSHEDEDYEDCGNVESGPMIRYQPAYDVYTSEEDEIFMCDGFVDRQIRDHELEAAMAKWEAELTYHP